MSRHDYLSMHELWSYGFSSFSNEEQEHRKNFKGDFMIFLSQKQLCWVTLHTVKLPKLSTHIGTATNSQLREVVNLHNLKLLTKQWLHWNLGPKADQIREVVKLQKWSAYDVFLYSYGLCFGLSIFPQRYTYANMVLTPCRWIMCHANGSSKDDLFQFYSIAVCNPI